MEKEYNQNSKSRHCCEEHHHEEQRHGSSCEHEYGCSCGHDHEHRELSICQIVLAAVFFATGLILEHFTKIPQIFVLIIFIVAYLTVGFKVLISAVKNLISGKMLDENFLMSVSSVAAFAIGSWSEAVAVMLFYNIGEYFQGLAVSKSRKSISDLMDICPDTANVMRDAKLVVMPCEEVKLGEIITIKPGEKVPLDAVVLSGVSELDVSALTGESELKSVSEGEKILSGCINKTGILTARVEKEFSESTASKIINMVENAASKKAPAENFITSFSRVYTPVVVAAALLIAVIPSLIFGGWAEWIRRGCVFLVISCPCALVISIPLTFFGGIGAASRKGILIKGGNYLEALSKVETVVFDKTGTLTKGNFSVSRVIPKNGFSENEVLGLAAKAESISNHPIARSIVNAANIALQAVKIDEAEEMPGYGVGIIADGEKIVVGNEALMSDLNVDYEKYKGAETVVYVLKNAKSVGCIVIEDEIKSDSKSAISGLKSLGVKKTVMLTGDVEKIAENVCAELGIDECKAELFPDQKVNCFEQISKNTQGITAFVGDGINDAPVLASADVGIAMGALGSDAAIEAADVVIMNDEPSKVAEAIRLAKETKKIVTQNIAFSLGVKGLFLLLGAFGVAEMWEAVFGDVGVMIVAVINAMRILKK